LVEVNNHRVWNEHVLRLPTDSQEMLDFLASMDGFTTNMRGGLRIGGKNFVVSMVDGPEGLDLKTKRQRGVEEQELFQKDWETDLPMEDNRNAMHKQGWAYFTIDGHIHGEHLSGAGRLPLYSATYKKHTPWIKLGLGDLVLVDTNSGAYAYDESSKAIARFKSKSFFKGFGRPWMGLHTIDTVRRDAAEQRVPFKTDISADQSQGIVELSLDPYTVVYTMDMNEDRVERLDIFEGETVVGKMIFTYSPSWTGNGQADRAPKGTSRGATHSSIGVNWISHLVSGTLLN
jgi:hypothetical protein